MGRVVERVRARLARSVSARIRAILGLTLVMQALLVLALLVATTVTQRSVVSLVLDRIEPIGELQLVASNFDEAMAAAQKVRSGNMSAASAISAIEAARAQADASWTKVAASGARMRHPESMTAVEAALDGARAAEADLVKLLRRGDADDLDFFVSGKLYAALDPLASASRALIGELRADASRERMTLDRVFYATYALAVLLALAAVLAGWWGARVANDGIAEPLAGLAAATDRIGFSGSGDDYPGRTAPTNSAGWRVPWRRRDAGRARPAPPRMPRALRRLSWR